MRRHIVSMPTHGPSFASAIRTASSEWSAHDAIQFVIHRRECDQFRDVLTSFKFRNELASMPPYEIIPHPFGLHKDGAVWFGAIRNVQIAHGQAALGKDDILIITDDDLNHANIINGTAAVKYNEQCAERYRLNGGKPLPKARGAGQAEFFAKHRLMSSSRCWRRAEPIEIVQREDRVADYAKACGMPFFDFGNNRRPKNFTTHERCELRPFILYTGVLGMRKDSSNYWPKDMSVGADYHALATAAQEAGGFAMMRDPCTVLRTSIVGQRYITGATYKARMTNGNRTIRETSLHGMPIVGWRNSNEMGNVPYLTQSKHLLHMLRTEWDECQPERSSTSNGNRLTSPKGGLPAELAV